MPYLKTDTDADRSAAAKARWGGTEAYREYERKTAGLSDEELRSAGDGLMRVFAGFADLTDKDPSDPAAQAQVKALQDYISGHFYTCTDEILAGLGALYAGGGEYAESIDRACGEGTAAFAAQAIESRFS